MRKNNEMRPINVAYNIYSQADSSVLFSLGKTQVLCAVTLQQGVPKFLKGKGAGWLTAEYALLPTATHERCARENTLGNRDGRTIEVSRIIGRTLRSCVDLSELGESTIIIDCDVLCADGGTRVASINAAGLALWRAQEHWLSSGRIKKPFLFQRPVALAIGVTEEHVLLIDPDYKEDSALIADFNIIGTQSAVMEVQGGAERRPLSWDLFMNVMQFGRDMLDMLGNDAHMHIPDRSDDIAIITEKYPLFSLKKRLASMSKE